MNDDTRYITTEDLLAESDSSGGWLSLGELGRYLEPDAIHVLRAVAGLVLESPDGPVVTIVGRFRTYRNATPVERPVLLPDTEWSALPTIENLVELLAPAGALLVREAEQLLLKPDDPDD